jgi:hypothetical protein
MCENRTCDYPVNEKEAKAWLEWSTMEIQKKFKETSGAEQEWVKKVHEKIRDREATKRLCPACTLQLFVAFLILEKKENLDAFILEGGLGIASKIAVIQHIRAVIADSDKKMKKTSDSNFGSFPIWFRMRVQRLEYKQPRNLTKEERESMRSMRSKGESLRDLAYIFDRSVSTVQQNCQGVEAVKTGVYY